MLDVVLLATGVVGIGVAALFRHLDRWSITPPLLGLMTGVLLGPHLLGALTLPAADDADVLGTTARLLLAVALMAAGLRYPVTQMRTHVRQIVVLVTLVLPVMAAVLAVGAWWTLQLPIGLALVLGSALSPTDPVLASGIVTGEFAERDIPGADRRILSLESGANDGLAMPFVVLALAVALDRPMLPEVGRVVYEVGAGIAVGLAAGWAAGRALRWAESHREIGSSIRSLYTLVLAALVLGLSALLHADGLLSVFVAGLTHNATTTDPDRLLEVEVDEALNHFLIVPLFILFGAALPWADWTQLGWGGIAFVGIALFLRRLPIILLLRGPLGTDRASGLWLGWFGPIGVAALYYLGHTESEGLVDPTVWAAGTLMVAVSTVVHGVTAGPSRIAYRHHTDRREHGTEAAADHDP